MDDLEAVKESAGSAGSAEHHQRDAAAQASSNSYKGLRGSIRLFSPQWFTLTMGTGITSILLYQFPYGAHWLYWLSVVVFALHALLIILFTFISVARLVLFPKLLPTMLRHPVESCYLGAFPVSLLSLANLISLICAPAWGNWAAELAWWVWIVASAIAALTAAYVPWAHVSLHHHHDSTEASQPPKPFETLKQISALHLLPPISTIVAATTAASVSQALPNPYRSASTVLTGYVLLGLGLSTAIFLMVLYLLRLLLFKLPARDMISSGFIPIGPLNMGAAASVLLGNVARTVFPKAGTGAEGWFSASVGDALYAGGVVFGLTHWAFGLLWLWFAIGGFWNYTVEDWWTHRGSRRRSHNTAEQAGRWGKEMGFPFNMSWWSVIFPLGTLALSSGSLANEIPSAFFRVIAAGVTTLVALLFVVVGILTVLDLVTNKGRKLLKSLAVEELDRRKEREMRDRGMRGSASRNAEYGEGEEGEDNEERTLKGVDSTEDVEGRRRRRGEGSDGSGSTSADI